MYAIYHKQKGNLLICYETSMTVIPKLDKESQKKITKLIFANTKQKFPAENRQTEFRSKVKNETL